MFIMIFAGKYLIYSNRVSTNFDLRCLSLFVCILYIRFHCDIYYYFNSFKTIACYLQFPPWRLSAANAKVAQTKVVQEWIGQEWETERMQRTRELTEQWLLVAVEFEVSTFWLTNVAADHTDVKWLGRGSCIYATKFWYKR